MPSTQPSRSFASRLIPTALILAQLFGCGASAWAATNPPAPTSPPRVLHVIRRALREFDRFLDHHPLPEDDLRLHPELITDRAYLGNNPELSDFLSANPNVLRGLKTYPRYYLFRALLRQASVPLSYPEIAQLKSVLDAQPAMEKALNREPESIRSPTFLRAHASLYEFLNQHVILKNAFSSHEDSNLQKS